MIIDNRPITYDNGYAFAMYELTAADVDGICHAGVDIRFGNMGTETVIVCRIRLDEWEHYSYLIPPDEWTFYLCDDMGNRPFFKFTRVDNDGCEEKIRAMTPDRFYLRHLAGELYQRDVRTGTDVRRTEVLGQLMEETDPEDAFNELGSQYSVDRDREETYWYRHMMDEAERRMKALGMSSDKRIALRSGMRYVSTNYGSSRLREPTLAEQGIIDQFERTHDSIVYNIYHACGNKDILYLFVVDDCIMYVDVDGHRKPLNIAADAIHLREDWRNENELIERGRVRVYGYNLEAPYLSGYGNMKYRLRKDGGIEIIT